FEYLLPFFIDQRYIKVDGKPLLMIYEPLNIPNSKQYFDQYRELAVEAGFPNLFIVSSSKGSDDLDYISLGYDANVSNSYHNSFDKEIIDFLYFSFWDKVKGKLNPKFIKKTGPIIINHNKIN